MFCWVFEEKKNSGFFLFSPLGTYLLIREKKMTSQPTSGWYMSEGLVENPALIILSRKFGSFFIPAISQMTLWKLGKHGWVICFKKYRFTEVEEEWFNLRTFPLMIILLIIYLLALGLSHNRVLTVVPSCRLLSPLKRQYFLLSELY